MNLRLLSLLLATALGSASAALAADTYPLDRVIIKGNKLVPSASLQSALTERAGTKVTKDQIIADQDAITEVYKKSKVNMGIKTLLARKSNGHVEVTFAIEETGSVATKVVHTDAKVGRVLFQGNTELTTDALVQAAALKPGSVIDEATLIAARDRIAAAYKAAKGDKNVSIAEQATQSADGTADITWVITESAQKKKKARDAYGGSDLAPDQ